jgi:hypothetical protein
MHHIPRRAIRASTPMSSTWALPTCGDGLAWSQIGRDRGEAITDGRRMMCCTCSMGRSIQRWTGWTKELR